LPDHASEAEKNQRPLKPCREKKTLMATDKYFEKSTIYELGLYNSRIIRAKVISFILIISLFNLELIFAGMRNSKGPDACSCSIGRGMCSFANSCCCPKKDVFSRQTDNHENKPYGRRDKAYICKLPCGENQTKTLPSPSARIYILTDHTVLAFNRMFSFYKPFPFYMPEEYIKTPPYKPPQKFI
jgi:hypothetical protein